MPKAKWRIPALVMTHACMQGRASILRKPSATMIQVPGGSELPALVCTLAAISCHPARYSPPISPSLASLTSLTHLTPLAAPLGAAAAAASSPMRRSPGSTCKRISRFKALLSPSKFPLEAISPHVLVRGMSPLTGSAHTGLLSSLLAPFCAV